MSKTYLCKNCKKVVAFHTAKRNIYCTNARQRQLEQAELLNHWLATGKLRNFTGGKSGFSPRNKYISTYLLKEQSHRCDICTRPFEWLGKPLITILDHKDGNSTNHSRPNLRLICPNCDSQTDTFKNRNAGRGRRSLGFSTNRGL